MIYVITMQDGAFVKVGFTDGTTADKRIASLQTASPFQLDLLFTVDGTIRQEQALHGSLKVAFHRLRIKIPGNEWYPGRHPVMKEFVGTLRDAGANAALLVSERYNPAVRQFGTGKRFEQKNKARQLEEVW